jgi:hypothetical protein
MSGSRSLRRHRRASCIRIRIHPHQFQGKPQYQFGRYGLRLAIISMTGGNPRTPVVAETRDQLLLDIPKGSPITSVAERHDALRQRNFDGESPRCARNIAAAVAPPFVICSCWIRAQYMSSSGAFSGKHLIMTAYELSATHPKRARWNDPISSLIALAFVSAAISGCQSTPVAKGAPNAMLINSGFVAKRATTPEQVAVLNSMPTGKFVRQTANGKSTYLYADQAGCGCIHAGDQRAFQSFSAMQNMMYDMNRTEFGGGLDPSNIGDLSNWEPF